MKALRLLAFFMAVGMAVVSCSKDDDDVAGIAGNKYETTYAKMVITPEGSAAITVEGKTKAELERLDLYIVVEFKSDGKFFVDDGEEGTWTQSGSTVTIVTKNSEGKTETSTGTIAGDVITIKDSGTENGVPYTLEMRFTKM